jgi:LL-diaminopimelate aminotransferase
VRTAKRIGALPPYLFAALDQKVREARESGKDVISFAIGDPDLPTPDHIVRAASAAVRDPATHQYPSYYGMEEFRQAISRHYRRRFQVDLNPDTQVLPLIGSKEGIAHLPVAFVDPDNVVLVPDPGYPVYMTTTLLCGGRPVPVLLHPDDGFLPELDGIDPASLRNAKILWLNYPNNPTGAVCELPFFEKAVSFCRNHGLLLAHDAAYVDVTYDGYVAPSVLQASGAIEVAVEFGSVSKTYNMTGWRVGWVVGAEAAIEALGRVKTNIDSGIFNALQQAAIAALDGPQEPVAATVETYKRRRDALVDALNSSGWNLKPPLGSIYVWVPTPDGENSLDFSEFLLDRADVAVAPGSGYGGNGEGFVRFSLTINDDRLEEGMGRIAKAMRQR